MGRLTPEDVSVLLYLLFWYWRFYYFVVGIFIQGMSLAYVIPSSPGTDDLRVQLWTGLLVSICVLFVDRILESIYIPAIFSQEYNRSVFQSD